MVATQKKSQIDKFREAARALESDENEARFNATLKRVAKAPPTPPKPKKGARKSK